MPRIPPNSTDSPRDPTPLQRAHRALLELARLRSFHGDNLAGDVKTLTEIAAHAVAVERASVWLLDDDRSKVVALDLFQRTPATHTSGMELRVEQYPAYFRAIEDSRLVSAHDAWTDPSTREFREQYLEPLQITSMLDAAVRQRGAFAGTICFEHVGKSRRWTTEEELFACAMADLVSLALESSRRQVIEAALAATERREREIIENSRDVIVLIGVARDAADGARYVVEALNPAAEALASAGAGNIRGKPVGEVLPERAANAALALIEECAASGAAVNREIEWDANGTRWFDTTFVPIRRDDGQVYRIACIAREITERVNAQREREQLQVQLHRSQKLEAIATLAAGVAHDFNNFLTGIVGNANLLLESSRLDTESRDRVQQIAEVANRAQDLVRQTLMLRRNEKQTRAPIAVADVVQAAIKLFDVSLPRGITITADIAARDATVVGDATQIHQVLANLLRNAVEAIDGDGTVRVHVDVVGVDESMALRHPPMRVGRYVRIDVTDSGSGIDAATQARLFEPFFTTKPYGKGTGLGLAVVYGIVREHDGVIVVSSTIGAGTTFRVYVPASDARIEPPRAGAIEPTPAAAGRKRTKRVLFVDDQAYVANLGAAMLKRLGYEAETIGDSRQALAKFRAAPDAFDIVLTDFAMPQLTGLELAREIHEARADIPIVLMTGYDGAIDPELAHAVGIREVLGKPFTLAVLGAVLERALA